MRVDLFTIVLCMGVLWFGGMLGGFIIPYMPWTGSAWIDGILIGIVQMGLLTFIGLISGKTNLWMIVFGGVLIFIGGIVGGVVVDFIDLGVDPLWNTCIILFTQTAILMVFGFLGKGKSKTSALVKTK